MIWRAKWSKSFTESRTDDFSRPRRCTESTDLIFLFFFGHLESGSPPKAMAGGGFDRCSEGSPFGEGGRFRPRWSKPPSPHTYNEKKILGRPAGVQGAFIFGTEGGFDPGGAGVEGAVRTECAALSMQRRHKARGSQGQWISLRWAHMVCGTWRGLVPVHYCRNAIAFGAVLF